MICKKFPDFDQFWGFENVDFWGRFWTDFWAILGPKNPIFPDRAKKPEFWVVDTLSKKYEYW